MKASAIGFVLLVTLPLHTGCFAPTPIRGDPYGSNHRLARTEPDENSAMRFDVSKPYRLEFGRGSGRRGYDTIALDGTGRVALCRQNRNYSDNRPHYWETAELSVDAPAYRRIAETIQDLRLVAMKRAYHANVHDGTQWEFSLTQGEQEKKIYFNNHFPEVIQDFAVSIDKELERAGLAKVKWTPVDNVSDESK